MANDPAVPDVKTPGGSFVPLYAVAFEEADGDAAAVTPDNPLPAQKGQQSVVNCTIASGGFLSAGVDLGVGRLVGIALPSNIDSVTTLSFQSSYDGTTWNDVYDSTGTEKTITVAASRRVILSPADFYGIRWVKVRYGTTGSHATTAGADRTLKLITEA